MSEQLNVQDDSILANKEISPQINENETIEITSKMQQISPFDLLPPEVCNVVL